MARFASVIIAALLFACGSPAPMADAGLDGAQGGDASQQGDAGPAVGVVGALPHVLGQGEDGGADVVGEVETDRVLDAASGDPVQELVGAAT